MNYYESSLIGMKRVLSKSGETVFEGYMDEFISEWNTSGSSDKFVKAFSKGGSFENFSFASTKFDSEEKRFWYTQLFGGLVAMAMQLVRFAQANRTMTVDFMRKNFGHPAEVISGIKCGKCGAKEINAADIDKYITPPVVSKAIIDGLESSCIEQKVDELLDLTSAHLKLERDEAVQRAVNSRVSVSQDRTHPAVCSKCGAADIVKCRFLKSVKTTTFVALSR